MFAWIVCRPEGGFVKQTQDEASARGQVNTILGT